MDLKNQRISIGLFLSLSLFMLLAACSDGKRTEMAKNIIINEVMASNRTGFLNEKGKPADWIEIKNTSQDSISLKGFGLAVVKMIPDSTNNGELKEEIEKWDFPDVKIGAGQCLVVFADKKKNPDKEDSETELRANFNLPKEGAKIQFLGPRGKVVSEVNYGSLLADQALALQADSTYQPTYLQSPGFENTKEGYEKASIKIDQQRKLGLRIWEFMTREEKSDENWVELKNTGTTDIDLSEYSLGKKPGKKDGVQLPAKTLKPGEFITFRLAGKNANKNNSMHLPFKPGNAETIVLTKNGKFVDGINAKSTPIGTSVGRMKDKPGLFYFAKPTKDEENDNNGFRHISKMPEFNLKPGTYPKSEKLTLRLKNPGQKVRYTLNGSKPGSSSAVFQDSIVITKGTVVRAYAEGNNEYMKSPIATYTYLPGAEHDIPVVSIAVNHGDLYNHSNGIYVKGPGYTEEIPHKGANYWQNWTKDAHVELIDGKEGVSVDCGLKIFGGYSRFMPKKSFRLKFRNRYGDAAVEYDFFGNGQPVELQDIVIRSGSQDSERCMIRDEFFTSLMQKESPELLTQLYQPVALYINGEYFGLYFLREKIDSHFIARKLNWPTDSLNMIMSEGYNEIGSKDAYNHLIDYVMKHDMKNAENYNYIKNLVDLQGLIDYKLGEIYSGNSDVGNIRYVRSTSPGTDKKWHFIFYDLDATWVGDKPSAAYYLAIEGNSSYTANQNKLINRLLPNKEFRELFLNRLSHHMKTTFNPKNSTAVFDELVEKIKPEMKKNCQRWDNLSYEEWERNIASFRKKFPEKPKVMLEDLRKYLKITDAENKKYFSNLGY